MKKILLLLFFLPLSLFAQDARVIKGVVFSSEDDQPLPGVNIMVKGQTRGTLSDMEGRFQLEVTPKDVLVFSFIGMKTEEVEVGEKSRFNLKMVYAVEQLNEVTVSAGYFDIKKGDVTGAIKTVDGETLMQTRTNSIESMLSGRMAGVVVTNSGEPGGGVGIAIRGANSMTGGTQPLYVVDGVPIEPTSDAEGNAGGGGSQSALSFINPNDIESINVLSDASATAVYGARGANGVIVITTKSVKAGKSKDRLSVNFEMYVSQVQKQIGLLDGPGFENYMNQRVINQEYLDYSLDIYNGTREALQPGDVLDLQERRILPYSESTGVSTNWQDLIYQQSLSKNFNLSYQGGGKDGGYNVSFGYLQNEGVVVNSNHDRLLLNFGARKNAFDNKLTFSSKTNIAHTYGRASSVGNGQFFSNRGLISSALIFQPVLAPLEDGQSDDIYAELNEGESISNPYTLAMDLTDLKKSYILNQTFQIQADITKDITFATKGAINYNYSERDTFYPVSTIRGRRNKGEATRSNLKNVRYYGEANLRFQKRFNGHGLDAIVLTTIEQKSTRSLFNKAYGFNNEHVAQNNFYGATDILIPVINETESTLLSGLGRIGYNYKSKYFIDVNGRVDASSKFASNNKVGFFPSVALGWTINKEGFLKDADVINNLKLRGSIGRIGNDPIPAYRSLAMYEAVRNNFDGSPDIGYSNVNLANDNLKWETTDQVNIGLDLAMFNGRLSFVTDVYYKETRDLLQWVKLPQSNGYDSKIDNFGSVMNKGIEVTLGYDLIKKKDFHWNLTGTFSLNRNELLKLNNTADFQLGPKVGPDQAYPSMFMEGKPLGIFWGAQTDGIYANWEEANELPRMAGARPGEIRYVNNHVDYNEDGSVADEQQLSGDDFVQIGDPNPDFNYSLNSSFKYKNWDFSFLITGQQGGDILWVESWQLTNLGKTTNLLASAYDESWKAPVRLNSETGDLVYDPSVGNTANAVNPAGVTATTPNRVQVSDRNVYDGSYIRLKSVNFGYTFPMKKRGRNLRLYLNGTNLFTITDYPGYDPEVQTYNKDPQKRGIDFGSYPGTSTYLVGLRFNY